MLQVSSWPSAALHDSTVLEIWNQAHFGSPPLPCCPIGGLSIYTCSSLALFLLVSLYASPDASSLHPCPHPMPVKQNWEVGWRTPGRQLLGCSEDCQEVPQNGQEWKLFHLPVKPSIIIKVIRGCRVGSREKPAWLGVSEVQGFWGQRLSHWSYFLSCSAGPVFQQVLLKGVVTKMTFSLGPRRSIGRVLI